MYFSRKIFMETDEADAIVLALNCLHRWVELENLMVLVTDANKFYKDQCVSY